MNGYTPLNLPSSSPYIFTNEVRGMSPVGAFNTSGNTGLDLTSQIANWSKAANTLDSLGTINPNINIEGFTSLSSPINTPTDNGGIFGNLDLKGIGGILGPLANIGGSFLSYLGAKEDRGLQAQQNKDLWNFQVNEANNKINLLNERAGTRQQTRDLSSDPFARGNEAAQMASYGKGVSNVGLNKLAPK